MFPLDFSRSITTVETITAQQANELLALNKNNRPISQTRMLAMAVKMERLKNLRAQLHREPSEAEIVQAGAWMFTHQGLGFDTTPALVDGQHRLTAQVHSGATITWPITTGLAPEAFDRVDVGANRSAADLLTRRMPGIENRSTAAATARFALIGMSGRDVERVVVVDFVEHYSAMLSMFVRHLQKNPLTRLAPLMGAFVAAARPLKDPFVGPRGGRDVELLELAAMRLAGQEWRAGKGDPLKALHSRLALDTKRASTSGRRTQASVLYSLTVSALRAELKGRSIASVQATEIDWGDEGDHIAVGTGDLRGKRGQAVIDSYREGRRVVDHEHLSRAGKLGRAAQAVKDTAAPEPFTPSTIVRRAR